MRSAGAAAADAAGSPGPRGVRRRRADPGALPAQRRHRRAGAAAEVTYWHVELDRHDVLLADGLPCESYLDTGNRGAFANGGRRAAMLQPDFALAGVAKPGCAELVTEGAGLEAARSWLLERAAKTGPGQHRRCRLAAARRWPSRQAGCTRPALAFPAAREVRDVCACVSRRWVPAQHEPDGRILARSASRLPSCATRTQFCLDDPRSAPAGTRRRTAGAGPAATLNCGRRALATYNSIWQSPEVTGATPAHKRAGCLGELKSLLSD